MSSAMFAVSLPVPKGSPEMIVDPMVFRSAAIYLRGRKGVKQTPPGMRQDEVWASLVAFTVSNRGVMNSAVGQFDAAIRVFAELIAQEPANSRRALRAQHKLETLS